jgi:phosphoribosylamine--glycine ligase
VLSVTAIGDNVQDCRQKAYEAVEEINWNDGFFRRDIGKL